MLAEFVNEGLGVNDVKLIELMIKPNVGEKLSDPWKGREFLCEVKNTQKCATDLHYIKLISKLADCF